MFTIKFLMAMNSLMRDNPDSWFLMPQGQRYHLAFGCGWVFTKYAQATKAPIVLRKVRIQNREFGM